MPIQIRELQIRAVLDQSKIDDDSVVKAMALLRRLKDDAHDEREAALSAIAKAAQPLLKAVTGAGQKLIQQLLAEVKDAQRELVKLRAAAEKAALAAAAKAKADAKAGAAEGEDDEEQGDYAVRLKAALNNLRRAKAPYRCIVNLAKPVDLFWLSRGLINGKQKELLTGLSGSKLFGKLGTVTRDGNMLVIDMPGAGGGMAARIQRAIQKAVGLRFKVTIGGEVADDAEEGAAKPADTKPPVALTAAPRVWQGTHDLLARRIDLLKKTVRKHYGPNGAEVLASIDKQLAQLDAVTDRLDRSLADALDGAAKAPAERRRDALVKAARQANDYIAWVRKDPIVRHIDGNPFGVPTQIEALVTRSLGEISKGLNDAARALA